MKVICKGYKTCEFIDSCYHAKEHNTIKNDSHKDGRCIIGNSSDCHCNKVYLRAVKLKKIQGENR